jgi:hypothetical protein
MKNYLLKLFCGLILIITSSTAFSQSVPELLWYKFDGTGTTVPNYASTPPTGTNTATIMGGLTQGSTGQCGGAIIGSGISSSTDYLNTGWATSLSSTSSWTISFWTSNITPSTTLFYIFGDATASTFRCFTNGVAGANNWILRGTGLTDVTVNGAATTAPTLTTFVYDMAAGNIKGYMNGVLLTTVAQGVFSITGTGPFKVVGYSTNVGMPLDGKLDEFRLYSRALSEAEILEIYHPYTSSVLNISACDSYIAPSGKILNTTGSFLDTIANATGCDSIITINLTVANTSSASISQTACDQFTSPSGNYTWTTSGLYNDTLTNAAGCDSVITVDLTILNSSSSIISPIACNQYLSPSGNYTWTTNGLYNDTVANAAGCDSLITIDLTILNSSSSSISPIACNQYFSPSGNYVWTTSGSYSDTISNAAGCDSLITVDLTILNNSTASLTTEACFSYLSPSGNHTWNTSGIYEDTLVNALGCDSILTIDLTIHSVVTTITAIDFALMSDEFGASYQWLDCDNGYQLIPGETNQSFTPSINGNYAVEVTAGACVDTSSCYEISGIGITENEADNKVNIHPNPSNGLFTVESAETPQQILVSDLLGNTLIELHPDSPATGIDLSSAAPGVYFVKIFNHQKMLVTRIVISK